MSTEEREDDLKNQLMSGGSDLPIEEGAQVDDEEDLPEGGKEGSSLPDWAIVPEGMALPPGKLITAVRFYARWTDEPGGGDRQCLIWNLTEADEKLALKRTRGESLRTIDELTKQSIRIVDGEKADWTKGISNVDRFWTSIGAKCRTQLKNVYVKNHSLEPAELADFFSDCVAVRSVAT